MFNQPAILRGHFQGATRTSGGVNKKKTFGVGGVARVVREDLHLHLGNGWAK